SRRLSSSSITSMVCMGSDFDCTAHNTKSARHHSDLGTAIARLGATSERRARTTTMQVTVIGTGYVGTVTGVCLAYLGHKVVCVDTDAAKIERLARGESP